MLHSRCLNLLAGKTWINRKFQYPCTFFRQINKIITGSALRSIGENRLCTGRTNLIKNKFRLLHRFSMYGDIVQLIA